MPAQHAGLAATWAVAAGARTLDGQRRLAELLLLALLKQGLQLLNIHLQFTDFQRLLDVERQLCLDRLTQVAFDSLVQGFLVGLAEFHLQAAAFGVVAGGGNVPLRGDSQGLLLLLGQCHPRLVPHIGQLVMALSF
jgi:hypothetical protein